MIEHTQEEIEILKKWFAIPEQDAWKWRLTIKDGVYGAGRITLDELFRHRADNDTV